MIFETVKIIGCGSIGNHLANASRSLGASVKMYDVDEEAVFRTRNETYPERYGAWDDEIEIGLSEVYSSHEADLIIIGTPPEFHISLAIEQLHLAKRAVLIEKPLASPDDPLLGRLLELSTELQIPVFVGYNHSVAPSFLRFLDLVTTSSDLGKIQKVEVEFREHWGGIFQAHPWLDGPSDSYLGFWRKGGGALCEHSHALHLWTVVAAALDWGDQFEVVANLDVVKDERVEYDQAAVLEIKKNGVFVGRVTQDVVTKPASKEVNVLGSKGFGKWSCGAQSDEVCVEVDGVEVTEKFPKNRPDDFIRELDALSRFVSGSDPTAKIMSLSFCMTAQKIIDDAFRRLT